MPGVPHIDRFNMPDIRNRSFTITAHVDPGADTTKGIEGVIVACGAQTGGHALFVVDGHLVFEYSRAGVAYRVRSDAPIPPEVVELGVSYTKEAEHRGTATLVIDGRPVGSGQHLHQSQHDRCCSRRPAIRRSRSVGDWSEGGWTSLPAAIRDRVHGK